ncbi:MAG: ABC transporter substrate-binding protein [Alphaproteobacteria bacterium]
MLKVASVVSRLVGLSLAVLAVAAPAAAQERAKLKMVFSIPPDTPVLPYLVAKDTGWYAQNGLDVEELLLSGDANALRAVLSGNGDVAQFGLSTVLQAIAESGMKLKTIGAWQPLVDYQFIAATGKAKRLEDFGGTVFATGSAGSLVSEIPKLVMRKHGVDMSTMTFVSVGAHSDRLKAVLAGKAQTSMVNMLTAARGVQENGVVVIASVKDDFPNLGFSFLSTTQENIADPKKKRAMEILVKGGIYGSRYIHENPAGAAAVLHGRRAEVSADFITPILVELNNLGVGGDTGGLAKDVVQFTADGSHQSKILSKQIRAEDVMETQFVDKALAELGRR